MGLFRKPNEIPAELVFYCKSCDITFTRNASVCRKTIYPAYANTEMTYYFTYCPDCEKQVSVRYD